MRAEHLKLLQDVEAQELLASAATRLARVQVPPEVSVGVAIARLAAFRKPNRGVHLTGNVARLPRSGRPLSIRQRVPTSVLCNRGLQARTDWAPALFALGRRDFLARAAASLRRQDNLLAFLDDLYVITVPSRARALSRARSRRGAALPPTCRPVGKTRAIT